jgi:hypothetical protein
MFGLGPRAMPFAGMQFDGAAFLQLIERPLGAVTKWWLGRRAATFNLA